MIITNVTIRNFRCYYGDNTISFNSNGKITLIYGDSGYGKSSLLQFFRWMFYNNPDFGKDNDKPLFNLSAYKDNVKKFGDTVEVGGQIDFEHLGIKYRLNKSYFYSYALTPQRATIQKSDFALQIDKQDGNGMKPFDGDIANQINKILPRGLSKYFLLDGERSREIVLEAKELKKAIQTLFELDAFEDAIAHIGASKNASGTVLRHYSSLMGANMTATINGMSISEAQEALQDLYEKIELEKAERKEKLAIIETKNARRDEIFKTLGEVAAKGNIEALIKANDRQIKEKKAEITKIQQNIGNLFYKNYPYLFMAKISSELSTILREKNHEYASNYQNIFEHLKKDLLKEIIEKDICVCGRSLDDDTRKRINAIIDIMPPGSYMYEFGQYISKAKRFIKTAQSQTSVYNNYLNQILLCENEISRLEDVNKEKYDELKRLNDAKDLVEELELIKKEIDQLNRDVNGLGGKIAQKKQVYEISNRKINEAIRNDRARCEHREKLEFFENILARLKEERALRELQVKQTLNECVRDVFKKLTTQTELDADKIQFVNDDFTLRTTYLTGGQLAVDVYSYVIGIVKALQKCEIESNENPIIIDAPFAFTGNEQSEHLFRTLPSVSKQTILLTLDLNKIKNLLSETSLYDFYVIKNESQEKATIERGDINAINI